MSWLPTTAPGASSFERVFGLCPELHTDFRGFAERFWTARPVDPVLLELCRLRVASLLGCTRALRARRPEAIAAGLAEDRIAALDDWRSAPAFSPAERACLAFTEKFVLDPHAVTDDDVAAITTHLSPAEVVALTEAVALFDGFTRFELMLGVDQVER